jgi:phosphoenolpyruvate carboxylase
LHKASSWQAKRYAGLSADQDLADKIFSALEAEWDRTVHALNEITGTQHRLAETPWLARFRHRFPYISPLNHLQTYCYSMGSKLILAFDPSGASRAEESGSAKAVPSIATD